MNMYQLRQLIKGETLDYNLVMSALSCYQQPRHKLHQLLKKGELVRIKKGLYVFGEALARQPVRKEILANLIYGPSYISLSYALAWYGLIPERVEAVTSITSKRKKFFQTPVGNFSYLYIPPRLFSHGIRQIEIDPFQHFLIATKEKALCDVLYRAGTFKDVKDLQAFLFDNLRVDESEFKELSLPGVVCLAELYKHRNLALLRILLETL